MLICRDISRWNWHRFPLEWLPRRHRASPSVTLDEIQYEVV